MAAEDAASYCGEMKDRRRNGEGAVPASWRVAGSGGGGHDEKGGPGGASPPAKCSAGSKRSLPGQEQSTRTARPKAGKTGRGWQASPITILSFF